MRTCGTDRVRGETKLSGVKRTERRNCADRERERERLEWQQMNEINGCLLKMCKVAI